MTKIRTPKKYNINKYRFREVYYHCLQYKEWKDELKFETNTVRSMNMDGMPHGSSTGNPTEVLAARRAELSRKVEEIERTAKEADPELWEYILKGVTEEYADYNYLSTVCNMPCGSRKYYASRRMFYYLMSKKNL